MARCEGWNAENIWTSLRPVPLCACQRCAKGVRQAPRLGFPKPHTAMRKNRWWARSRSSHRSRFKKLARLSRASCCASFSGVTTTKVTMSPTARNCAIWCSRPGRSAKSWVACASPALRGECRRGIVGSAGTSPPGHATSSRWSVIAASCYLPWVQVRNLASHVLSLAARRVAVDWPARYGNAALLLETLVDPERFSGTCYRAANWIEVGITSGRGRMDRGHQRHNLAPKKVLLYPLVKHAARRLREA